MEWKEAGDVVVISGSFTSGTILSAILVPHGGTQAAYVVAAAAMLSAVAALAVFASKGRSRFAAVPVFVALGATCFAGAAAGEVSHTADAAAFGPARAALAQLQELIDGMPFAYRNTAPLLRALLTGSRERLPPEVVADFRSSGASHILALSGLHLGVIYGILSRLLSPLGHSRAASAIKTAAILASASFYALMTGCSPSIVRALLFIWINELCGLTAGRRKNPLAVFCSALMIQLVISPGSIRSLGFRLSYLAMLGIFLIYPVLRGWYPSGDGGIEPGHLMRHIWNSAAMTLSCQVFTAPLVWKTFHTFPKHFLLTNLLALPLTECLTVMSITALVLTALGICPGFMTKAADLLAHCLIFSLQVISSL